jgi:hypothetical protein
MYSLEQQFKTGKLTHLMELEIIDVSEEIPGLKGYNCAFCGLRVADFSLRKARRVAEQTYGKCRAFKRRVVH